MSWVPAVKPSNRCLHERMTRSVSSTGNGALVSLKITCQDCDLFVEKRPCAMCGETTSNPSSWEGVSIGALLDVMRFHGAPTNPSELRAWLDARLSASGPPAKNLA